jgi:hypothetical protein
MGLVKGGYTEKKDSLSRGTIVEAEEYIIKFKKGKIAKDELYRSYPIECFYKREVILEIRFDTKPEAKACEKAFKDRFKNIITPAVEFNGYSEVRDVTVEELVDYVVELKAKHSSNFRPWKYPTYTFYLHLLSERETPKMSELLLDSNNIRMEYAK